MPREARKKKVYSTYYLYQEGPADQPLFLDTEEKELFVKILGKTKRKYDFKLYAFCLKDNFYKLILFDNGNDITKIMKSINVSYTMRVNKKRHRKGSLFEKRFQSKIIYDGKELLEFSKNIHLDIEKNSDDFNSFCTYFDNKDSDILDKDLILNVVVGNDKANQYKMYIQDKKDLEEIVCDYDFQECIDEDQCIKNLDKARIQLNKYLKEHQLTFKQLLDDKQKRNALIKDFRRISTLTLKELGKLFGGLTESTICKILSKED
jgi:REP element-mobilizing transposase RayT